MKKSLLTLSICFAIASIAKASGNCSVPQSLVGQDVLAMITEPYLPTNPMANHFYRMKFNDNGHYDYLILNTGKQHSGSYRYRVISNNIGVIDAIEKFDNIPTQYTMTLVCDSDKSGIYSYNQEIGEGGTRANTGRYFFMTAVD